MNKHFPGAACCCVLPRGADGEGSSSSSAVAGSACSPGCCGSLRKEQHVISSSNTGQVGSHFGHILFHDVSFPFLYLNALRWKDTSVFKMVWFSGVLTYSS